MSGEQKENRKLTLDISKSADIERIVKDRTVWEITSDNLSSETVCIDEESSDELTKNLIIKQAGHYAVKVTVFTDKKSYTYEKELSVVYIV